MKKIIIFVHGLSGKAEKTWQSFDKLIKEDSDLNNYKIEYYSYPTSFFSVFKKGPKIQDLSDGLSTLIDNKYSSFDEIILVCHSMGGLIAKNYLLNLIKNKRDVRKFKLLLFAVPNNGSKLASLSKLVSFTNFQIKQLCKNSDFIDILNNDLNTFKFEDNITIKYIVGSLDKIVDKASLNNNHSNRNIETLADKDHFNIITPTSKDDLSFIIFKNFLNSSKLESKNIENLLTSSKKKIITNNSDSLPQIKFWVGRKKEISAIQQSNQKIIFISGLGGQGKSSLASHIIESSFIKKSVNLWDYWDWRDFKDEENRLSTKMINIIERFDSSEIDCNILSQLDFDKLLEIFFKVISNKKVIFVFDNIDKYMDLQILKPTDNINKLINKVLNSSHNNLFIFTCRLMVDITSIDFLSIKLDGLSLEDSLNLAKKFNINLTIPNMSDLVTSIHNLTNGHVLWMNLILAQSYKGEIYLNNFIKEIKNRTSFDDENSSSVMAKEILDYMWTQFKTEQKDFLEKLSVMIKPYCIDELLEIFKGKIYPKDFKSILNYFKKLSYIVEKLKNDDLIEIELHPLVKEHVQSKINNKINKSNNKLFVKYHELKSNRVKERLSYCSPFYFFEDCLDYVSYSINNKEHNEAIEMLVWICPLICSAGFRESFIRLSLELFRKVNFKDMISNETIAYKRLFEQTINLLIISNYNYDVELLLNKYKESVNSYSEDYVIYCDLMCNYYWFNENYYESLKYGLFGINLLKNIGLDKTHNINHNYSLALRDTREDSNLDIALKFFLFDESIDTILSKNHVIDYENESFYGNIGRTLFFKSDVISAFKFYIICFNIVITKHHTQTIDNHAYISEWIADLYFKRNEIKNALLFYKYSMIFWDKISPTKKDKISIKINNIIELYKEFIDTIHLTDSYIEISCKEIITNEFQSLISSYEESNSN